MSQPKLKPKAFNFLTIAARRSVQQKTHSNIGHAKNVFTQWPHLAGTLWKWSDELGDWELLYTVVKGEKLPWT